MVPHLRVMLMLGQDVPADHLSHPAPSFELKAVTCVQYSTVLYTYVHREMPVAVL